MKDLESAQTVVATLDLAIPVEVRDVSPTRRAIEWRSLGGANCGYEFDADPSEEQLLDLARSLPLKPGKLDETRKKLVPPKPVKPKDGAPVEPAEAEAAALKAGK